MQIYRSEFLANQAISVERKDEFYSNTSSMAFTKLKFTKLKNNFFTTSGPNFITDLRTL